jgi:hypothetical protein
MVCKFKAMSNREEIFRLSLGEVLVAGSEGKGCKNNCGGYG